MGWGEDHRSPPCIDDGESYRAVGRLLGAASPNWLIELEADDITEDQIVERLSELGTVVMMEKIDK